MIFVCVWMSRKFFVLLYTQNFTLQKSRNFFVLLYAQEFYSPKVLPHFPLKDAQEFQSVHVHNDLSNFQKADGVAVMMGQLSQLPKHHS